MVGQGIARTCVKANQPTLSLAIEQLDPNQVILPRIDFVVKGLLSMSRLNHVRPSRYGSPG